MSDTTVESLQEDLRRTYKVQNGIAIKLVNAEDRIRELEAELLLAKDGLVGQRELIGMLQARLTAARQAHWKTAQVWPATGQRVVVCGNCTYLDGVHRVWPCPTVAALTDVEAGSWESPTLWTTDPDLESWCSGEQRWVPLPCVRCAVEGGDHAPGPQGQPDWSNGVHP